jgi:Fe-S-cluster containining protein
VSSTTRTETCDNCGACCIAQCSPPGYLLLICQPQRSDEWPDKEDVERVKRLPHGALLVINRYRREAARKGSLPDDAPCVWLDMKTMRCRWYEHRPQICRDFKSGSEDCQMWQDKFNVARRR